MYHTQSWKHDASLGGQLSQAGWEPLLALDKMGHYNAGQRVSTFLCFNVVPHFLRHNRR